MRIARVAVKALKLLGRKTKNPSEAYLASKFLTIYFENTLGFEMLPSDEKDFTDFVKEITKREDNEDRMF